MSILKIKISRFFLDLIFLSVCVAYLKDGLPGSLSLKHDEMNVHIHDWFHVIRHATDLKFILDP